MRGKETINKSRSELVIVTGASTGIGAATAQELANRGFHVLAGVRRQDDLVALRARNIEPILLDITKEADIGAVRQRVMDDPQQRDLRALVNNAGVGMNAPVETLALAEWRKLFDVNLFGHVAMLQALLPALLKNRGTVVNISSVGGKVAMATYGPYASTKFALEAVSDALRRKLAPLGLKVVVIEPGAVATGMLARVSALGEGVIERMTSTQRDRYTMLMRAIISQAEAAVPRGTPSDDVARAVAKAITSARPKTRYTVGRDAALVAWLARLLSDRALDKLFARALRSHPAETPLPR